MIGDCVLRFCAEKRASCDFVDFSAFAVSTRAAKAKTNRTIEAIFIALHDSNYSEFPDSWCIRTISKMEIVQDLASFVSRYIGSTSSKTHDSNGSHFGFAFGKNAIEPRLGNHCDVRISALFRVLRRFVGEPLRILR